jgi:uncharacterized protein (TIGR03083 family)
LLALSVFAYSVATVDGQVRGSRGYQAYCDAVGVEAARFAEVVTGVDPATAVPTCPGWTMADLIAHHGRSQRRVEHVVRHRSQQPVWSKDVPAGLPDATTGYPAWFAEGVAPLIATLRSADPVIPMWTNGADRHTRYWARRILYEAVVHRADAELAVGRTPVIDTLTAVDGIDELLTNLPCFSWVAERQRGLGRDGDTLHLRSTDIDAGWVITLGRDGFDWHRGGAAAVATAAGTAGDLLLLVYGRFKPADDRLTVSGDQQLLTGWLTKSAL